MTINIQETFQDTIQGEGFHSGTPADFIRTYGCPVGCWFCDTGYSAPDGEYYKKTLPKKPMEIDEIVSELKSPLVVITGGEPFIHKELGALCSAILKTGRMVSIETSGSYFKEIPDDVWVTLSPKDNVSPKFPSTIEMWERANELKIIVCLGNEYQYYEDRIKDFKGLKYFQPEFEDKSSISLTRDLIIEHKDFKLSLQTHKIIGLP